MIGWLFDRLQLRKRISLRLEDALCFSPSTGCAKKQWTKYILDSGQCQKDAKAEITSHWKYVTETMPAHQGQRCQRCQRCGRCDMICVSRVVLGPWAHSLWLMSTFTLILHKSFLALGNSCQSSQPTANSCVAEPSLQSGFVQTSGIRCHWL